MIKLNRELWWGYVHINGSHQVKRFFDPEDLTEAERSPFVSKVEQPFMAKDRDQALKKMKKLNPDEIKKI